MKFNMNAIGRWHIVNTNCTGHTRRLQGASVLVYHVEAVYHVIRVDLFYCMHHKIQYCWFGYLSYLFECLQHAERRSISYQLEFLFNYYIRILRRHQRQSSLLKVWESISQGLQIYPFSPELLKGVVEVGHFHTTSNRLRRILDDCCYK